MSFGWLGKNWSLQAIHGACNLGMDQASLKRNVEHHGFQARLSERFAFFPWAHSWNLPSHRLTWKLPGPVWKTWFHLHRPSGSFHASSRECTQGTSCKFLPGLWGTESGRRGSLLLEAVGSYTWTKAPKAPKAPGPPPKKNTHLGIIPKATLLPKESAPTIKVSRIGRPLQPFLRRTSSEPTPSSRKPPHLQCFGVGTNLELWAGLKGRNFRGPWH